MRARRPVFIPAVAALVLAVSAQAAPSEPPAGNAGTIEIAYSLAFWGIPFGETSYDGRFSNGGYSASSHFNTSGIVSIFWQATIDATATGHVTEHAVGPLEYDSFFRRGSLKKERVK